jgi:glucokinase
MDRTLILAGDVGGTKTYLALCDASAQSFAPIAETRCETAAYSSIGLLLKGFVDEVGHRPACVVLGVPGPVRQLPVRAVNLPWMIDPAEIQSVLELDQVYLLNDLEATAYGTQVLLESDMVSLSAGIADPEGNVAVIAPGTGLGEGGLCWTGTRYTAVASEGGHSSFSPSSQLEMELWSYLHQRHGHISWERILSGPGLASIYDFLRDAGHGTEPEWLTAELAEATDRASVVSRAAQEGRCGLAVQALDMFVLLCGEEAGNLALKLMATGGVFLGGGIAPKIVDQLRRGRFLEGFLNKGRMDTALRTIPVRVVLNDKTGLMGAAYRGAQLLG